MFSSNNCTTSNDPINPYFNNKTTFLNPNKNTNYVNIISSNPKQEDNLPPLNVQPTTTTTPPLPFSGFSTSPFEIDQNEDHFLLHQNHFVNVSPYNYSQPMIMMELSANTDHQNINNIVATTPPPPSLPQVVREPNNKTLVDSSSKMKKKINLTDQENIPRKRSTGKRDRHSKINTARGLRDRRMRLSLEVARKFFGLQDMLGFDKASKTVEWLLTQSKSEIKKLGGELNYRSSCTKSASSTNNSESEVVSCNIDEVAINIEQQEQQQQHSSTINGSTCKPLLGTTKRKKRQSRKIVINPLAKESRDKARERARERAKEKRKSRSIRSSFVDHHHHDHVSSKPFDHDHQNQEVTNNHDHLRLPSCWSPFHHQTREESGLSTQTQSNINNSSSLQVLPPQEVEETINVNVDDHSFVNMEKYWSPSALIFNSLHNNEISQHENFADFPILWQNMDP